ncbi:MAG: ATP-binding cassette domain-containing protein [Alphaproteobacteria bacterium]|nr:ATP-binding cassette domain-containing protein [Alphaproteobacteria bacterium]
MPKENIMTEDTLELRDISVGYGEKTLLHGLNMVFAGDRISFVAGANGVGKSLLLKTLAGFIAPQHGMVMGIKHQLPALMHQKPIILNRSVYENLRFILRAENSNAQRDNQEIDNVLMQVGLFDMRHKNAWALSVGQQKLLSFASIIMMRRDYWLLDEPTASLAPDTKNKIEQLISDARKQGQKMVIVSHDMAQIKLLAKGKDDILFLHHCDETQDMPESIPGDNLAVQPIKPIPIKPIQVSDFFKNPPNAQAKEFINHIDFNRELNR